MPHKKSPDGYLSVTEALSVIRKPFLEMWRGKWGNKECNRIQKESKLLGETVHAEIVRQFNGLGPQTKDKNAIDMVGRFFREFVLPYKVSVVSMEPDEPLRDEELKLQGTYDAVIQMDGKDLIIADWKTSNQLDTVSVPLQLSAYAYLWSKDQEWEESKIIKGVAVRIDKKADKLDVVWYPDVREYWPIFLTCLKLAQYVKSAGK